MKDIIVYNLIKMLIMIMSRVPTAFLTFFSDVLGLIWFKIDKRHRTVVFNNINKAYPNKFSKGQALRFTKKKFSAHGQPDF